jgi:hypothetical protein
MDETTQLRQQATEAVLAEIGAADSAPIRLRVQDAPRIEWTIALPLRRDEEAT